MMSSYKSQHHEHISMSFYHLFSEQYALWLDLHIEYEKKTFRRWQECPVSRKQKPLVQGRAIYLAYRGTLGFRSWWTGPWGGAWLVNEL